MEECYNRARVWVPDDQLLELASQCLPPPLDYTLDSTAIAEGRWKDAVSPIHPCFCTFLLLSFAMCPGC